MGSMFQQELYHEKSSNLVEVLADKIRVRVYVCVHAPCVYMCACVYSTVYLCVYIYLWIYLCACYYMCCTYSTVGGRRVYVCTTGLQL